MIKRVIVLVLGFLLLASCVTNPITGKKEFMVISESTEVSVGADAVPSVEYQYGGIYPNNQVNQYVNAVGQKLARVSHRPKLKFQFKVLNTSMINAFALPGGFIYITRGLLVKMDNEAQLAAVLGHEIGHVTARHGAKRLQSALGFQFLVKLALSYDASRKDGSPSKGLVASTKVGSVLFNVISLGYGRENEYQADELGMVYARQAGYKPQGVIELLNILREMEKGHTVKYEFLSSHPPTSKRIESATQKMNTKYPDAANLGYAKPSFGRGTKELKEAHEVYIKEKGALAAYKQGDLEKTLSIYTQATKELPNHAYFYMRRGLVYLKSERHKDASYDFTKALQLEPNNYDARVGLGRSYLMARQYPRSQNELGQAINLLPPHPAAHFYLGESYLGMGNRDQANEEFSTVLQVAPADSSYAKQAQQRINEIKKKK